MLSRLRRLAARAYHELVFRTVYSARNAEFLLQAKSLGEIGALSPGEIERAAEFKSEYYRGEMFAMAGASFAHSSVGVPSGLTINIAYSLMVFRISTLSRLWRSAPRRSSVPTRNAFQRRRERQC